MDSLPKRPNTPPSPPRRGSRHVSPPTAQRPGPSSWEPPRARSPGVWDRDRGRPMYRPRSRSRSRSYDYNYDFPRRRTPPPPLPHSRLPRRAWERSRSRSPPQQPKSSVPCKYFSRPTGCDKGNRCRFRHEGPRSRSFTRSRSRSRSPPRSPRSRSPPLRYRGDSPMLVPRGGMRSPQPSLLQRLGPVAPMRPASPMRGRATSNDPNEPLEEGEERSPGRRTGKSRPRGRRRSDRKEWDSFVADEDEEMSEYEGRSSKRGDESRRDHSRSRSQRPRTGSPSRSRSRSPRNTAATTTRSNSQEKRSQHPPPSRSRSRSHSPRSVRSATRSRDRSLQRGGSPTRSGSRASSKPPRSRSRSPYRQSHRTRDRESWTERDRKSSTPAPNPGTSSATVNVTGPPIPTGPRVRTGVNPPPAPPAVARTVPTPVRGGAPPTGPRGDREPPRGPRNMVALNAGPPPSAPGPNTGPGWERPQLAFQSYLAAVQSKLDERQGKKKDDDTADDEPDTTDAIMTGVKIEPDAMDLDAPEERDTGRSYSNTPAPGPSVEGSRVASPAYPNVRQSSVSLHASPLVGQGLSLPASSGTGLPHTTQPVQTHPLPLPPRPRSPPRGPRATRGLPEKPKGVGPEPSREGGAERDRGADIIDRGRDRNDWADKGKTTGELERKPHTLVTNSARQVRVPTPRATTRNSLFPELEKEIAALEEQRARLANEHFPLEIALRQAVDELALSTIECRAAEDRRIMTETVLEAMVKGSGLAVSGDI